MALEIPLDRYGYQARLQPALITFAPVGFAFAVWSPPETTGLKLFVGVFVSLGFATLLAQFGRDLGKRKEPYLFARWGVMPSVRLLSHRLSSLSPITLKRYHLRLKQLLPTLQIPEANEERKNPIEAVQVYESCSIFLRETTRDQKRFPLVFAENVNYGFRRNLWAWRPYAIASSSVGALSATVFVALRRNGEHSPVVFASVVGIASVILLLLWIFKVTPEWVRLAADAYAERLVGSLDSLGS